MHEPIPQNLPEELSHRLDVTVAGRTMELRRYSQVGGIELVSVFDAPTGIETFYVYRPGEGDYLSTAAYTVVTVSRSEKRINERRVVRPGVRASQRIGEIYDIGHSAPAGLVGYLIVEASGLSVVDCMILFGEANLHQGQEASTRFQEGRFTGQTIVRLEDTLPGIEKRYVEQYNALALGIQQVYETLTPRVQEAFSAHWQPEDNKEQKSIVSRALDATRNLLLAGKPTAIDYATDARTLSRVIGLLRVHPDPHLRITAEQMLYIMTMPDEQQIQLEWQPPAKDLIRHADPNTHLPDNLQALYEYLNETGLMDELKQSCPFSYYQPGMDLLRQPRVALTPPIDPGLQAIVHNFQILWPGISANHLATWLQGLSRQQQDDIVNRVLNGYDEYHEPYQFMNTGMGVEFDLSVSLIRDLNRHRSLDKFLLLPTQYGMPLSYERALQVLAFGYNLPRYFIHLPEFNHFGSEMKDILDAHYRGVYDLIHSMHEEYGDTIDYGCMLNLLPLAHVIPLTMYGSYQKFNYMSSLRFNPGGDIGYILACQEAAHLLAQANPWVRMKVNQKLQLDPALFNPLSRMGIMSRK